MNPDCPRIMCTSENVKRTKIIPRKIIGTYTESCESAGKNERSDTKCSLAGNLPYFSQHFTKL